ncbi:MAG: hypothetical protein WA821_08915 [Anaerolineales bacterium]
MPAIQPNSEINCFCEPGPGTGKFTDYCKILSPGQEVILCELNIQRPKLPYHISLVADGQDPLMVLALEKYVDDTHGVGRKTDFLIAGQNPCKQRAEVMVVFLEMRDELTSKSQWYRTAQKPGSDEVKETGKLPQCKEAINLLCKNGDNYRGLHGDGVIQRFLSQVNRPFERHQIAAAVIPVLFSKSRGRDSYRGYIGDKPTLIIALPDSLFKKSVTWKQLLRAMGLVNC